MWGECGEECEDECGDQCGDSFTVVHVPQARLLIVVYSDTTTIIKHNNPRLNKIFKPFLLV